LLTSAPALLAGAGLSCADADPPNPAKLTIIPSKIANFDNRKILISFDYVRNSITVEIDTRRAQVVTMSAN